VEPEKTRGSGVFLRGDEGNTGCREKPMFEVSVSIQGLRRDAGNAGLIDQAGVSHRP
jgi:hypothetical protein